jgi:hypothetical protein
MIESPDFHTPKSSRGSLSFHTPSRGSLSFYTPSRDSLGFQTPKTSKDSNDFQTPKTSKDSDFDEMPEMDISRNRSHSILIPGDIIKSQHIDKPLLEAQDQKNLGVCFAHATTRLIVRFIAKIIPTILDYKNDFEDDKKCYITDANDITEIKFILTINKCKNKNRYNYIVLYYYIFVLITNKYGCAGNITNIILRDFIDTSFLTQDLIITKEIDKKARTIIGIFKDSLKDTYNLHVDIFETRNNKNYKKNWITDFPEGAKKALKSGLYVIMDFYLPVNQMEQITNIFNISKTTTCVPPILGHSVIITKWEIEPYTKLETVTILNSWGKGWGNDGMIKINALNYDKFSINHSCHHYYMQPLRFKYFLISSTSKGKSKKSKRKSKHKSKKNQKKIKKSNA